MTLAAYRRRYRQLLSLTIGPGAGISRSTARAILRHDLRRHQRRQALRFLRTTTAQLAFDDLYPVRRHPPCPPS